jgi:hypothetical protein
MRRVENVYIFSVLPLIRHPFHHLNLFSTEPLTTMMLFNPFYLALTACALVAALPSPKNGESLVSYWV